MTDIQRKLKEIADEDYAAFQAKLTPNVDPENIIGIRIPVMRIVAREYFKDPEHVEFMRELPHKYYDENLLHGLLIEHIKDFDECVTELDRFLPYVDNWAVCDTCSPKVLKKNKPALLEKIREWAALEHAYTCRFGLKMLMSYFLDADFRPEYLEIPAAVKSEEYYVNMMIAWFFATALAKQWDETIPYIKENRLPAWVHNKTIQKAVESYRVTDEQKALLRSLRLGPVLLRGKYEGE